LYNDVLVYLDLDIQASLWSLDDCEMQRWCWYVWNESGITAAAIFMLGRLRKHNELTHSLDSIV